jgi:hypothetical protein
MGTRAGAGETLVALRARGVHAFETPCLIVIVPRAERCGKRSPTSWLTTTR